MKKNRTYSFVNSTYFFSETQITGAVERLVEGNFRCMYCRMIVQWFDRKKVKVLCLNAEACRQIELSLIKLIQELDTDVGQGVKYQQVSTWLS